MCDPIMQFRGEHRFLSNFYFVKMEYEGIVYNSVEHAFCATKTLDQSTRIMFSHIASPAEVRALGRKVKLREDWEDIKLKVMEDLIDIKFNVKRLARLLLETDGHDLIEGNFFNDRFWGVCLKTNTGENHLGKILVAKRNKLKLDKERGYL